MAQIAVLGLARAFLEPRADHMAPHILTPRPPAPRKPDGERPSPPHRAQPRVFRRLLLGLGGLFAHAALTLAALAAVLAANADQVPDHWNPWRPFDPAAPWTMVQDLKLDWALEDDGLCLSALARVGGAERMPDLIHSPQCGIVTRVNLVELQTARLEPMETSCPIALALYVWDRETLQPAARDIFGVDAARLHHFGSYSCRTIAGSARMSRHARARAVDISGITLADGRRITLSADWHGDAAARRFLRRLRDGACERFDVVLSPDYNEAHRDHFHLDLAERYWSWSACR